MTKIVFTIGYEGSDIDQLVQTLKAVGVKSLVDVRAVPISRKRGFSKNSLRDRLADEGIGYVHLRGLGDPKPGRNAAREGRMKDFRRIFTAHMKTAEAIADLRTLMDLAGDTATCLLCFERDHTCCHRSIVMDHLTVEGYKCFNLCPDDPERYAKYSSKIPRRGARESIAAAE